MNIILKQPEIEAAIRLYVGSQGISLRNRSVSIDFTSGRGTNGLSVELTINDIVIPDDVATIALPSLSEVVAAEALVQQSTTLELKTLAQAIDTTKLAEVAGVTVAEAAAVVEELVALATTEPDPAIVDAPLFIAPAVLIVETAVAAIATPETEAAKAMPVAEAKPAVPTPALFASAQVAAKPEVVVVVEAAAEPVKTSSLFGA